MLLIALYIPLMLLFPPVFTCCTFGSLFLDLQAIGLPLEDALMFWRLSFAPRTPSDKFDKEYAYNIRHNYGKVERNLTVLNLRYCHVAYIKRITLCKFRASEQESHDTGAKHDHHLRA